jgi:hypothetical protein
MTELEHNPLCRNEFFFLVSLMGAVALLFFMPGTEGQAERVLVLAMYASVVFVLVIALIYRARGVDGPGLKTGPCKSALQVAGGWLGLCVGLYCADRFAPRYPDSHLEDTLTGLTLFVGPGISISLHWWLGGFIGAKLDRMREAEEKP